MRLLCFDSLGRLTSENFSRKALPPYAILSHTWDEDEFLFDDLVNGTGEGKAGYKKIMFCGEQAARDRIQYFWVDTCCIDKWNLRELSHAINSMFLWYKKAARCYTYLSDVSTSMVDAQQHQNTWETSFQKSRWFTRGWTLQELLAPASIDFFCSSGQRLGDKDSLEQQIHQITRIPIAALRGDPLDEFSVADRMAWMMGRQTTEAEDMAYSLIGIFGVVMEFRYGEGKERAQRRLQEAMEKAATAPFIVPFDQNSRFTGRESQLAELQGKLQVETATARVAITGPSGIGKTQLALEFAYKLKQEHETCSVFWISASDKESLYQGYTQIARRLRIAGWDDEKADVRKLVQLYLSNESAGPWLLVFDNVGEASQKFTRPSTAESLIEYLPSSRQGAIVFTTVNRETATKLALEGIVELPEMEQDMAQRMLETCLVDPVNEQEGADLLLQGLAYLPLAIVQAAAYMNINRITPKEYLELLIEKQAGGFEALQQDSESVIAATWFLAFEQIRRNDISAAFYLLFMGCVDRNDVPVAILPAPLMHDRGVRAIQTLSNYALVTRRTGESALDLHRLVHSSTRKWLEKEGFITKQTHAAITRLLEVFPDDNHGNRSKWRRLLPHAKFALSDSPDSQEYKARTTLLWKCATALYNDGRWTEAEEMAVQVLETFKRVLGEEHSSTLTSMANLASTYRSQGRWKEAEELDVQVLKTEKRVLGEEHPDTLISMGNLASTYSSQGRWREAEELEVQVMETFKRVLTEEHPDTLNSMANLASTYSSQGRWKEAEELGVQVIEMRKRVIGEEHPDTLTSMANLALTYGSQGRWKEAEKLEVQVIETRKRVLGGEHPSTLISMTNLASTYGNQGRWKEAEELEVHVLEKFKRVFGEEHPSTLTTMANLTSTYRSQGRWKEAEVLDLQVMETFKRVHGEEHPSTLNSMANLGSTYRSQGRWKEAEELEVQVMETRKRVLGEEHPSTLNSMNNLAFTLKSHGSMRKATSLLEDCCKLLTATLGPQHPNTISAHKNLSSWKLETLGDGEQSDSQQGEDLASSPSRTSRSDVVQE